MRTTALLLIVTASACFPGPGGPNDSGAGGSGGSGGAGGGTSDAGPRLPTVLSTTSLKPSGGGRVDWCRGGELIAYDAVDTSGTFNVHTMLSDGGQDRCVTCATPGLSPNFRSQPAWDPTCQWLVIQAESTTLPANNVTATYKGPGWGINADLWFVSADGTRAVKAVQITAVSEASLHPHFSDDGTKLFWTARDVTGITADPARGYPWNGWYLNVADVTWDAGTPSIGPPTNLFRTAPAHLRGFYESHALEQGTLWFSRTLPPPDAGQHTFVDESFRAPLSNPSAMVNVTEGPGHWEEHGVTSPRGTLVSFNSSRGGTASYPPDSFSELSMEVWARPFDLSKAPVALTTYNAQLTALERAAGTAVVTSDYDWAPDGRRLVVYSVKKQPSGAITSQRIDVLQLDSAY